ncbi:MAG: putative lipid II flippase FtsW [Vicinamibacterales bacterium]
MARKLTSDKWLFTATLLLVCISVVMVYSASAVMAMEQNHAPYYYLFKQLAWALLGLIFLPIVMRIDYRNYRQPAIIWTMLGVVAVALVAVLFGRPVNGASRWLLLGPLGIQPSELAKIAVIFCTAALLERRMDRIDEIGYSLVPIGITVGVIVALILLEPDLGTAVTVLMIAAVMVFAAGLHYTYLLGLVLTAAPAAYLVIATSEYRMKRVTAFLDPYSDPLGDGYQMIQSMIAVGTGGITGRGLMDGLQKLFYLPEPHNDFIFSVIGEELGLIGATVVVACFCVITWRGLRTAMRAPDRFGAFVAIGLTTMIAFQAFFNISVVLGLLPTKGIPLPFVSAGGSSLLINMIGMAVLLNVSQHAVTTRVVTAAMPPANA